MISISREGRKGLRWEYKSILGCNYILTRKKKMGLYVTELYLNVPLEIKQVNSLPVTAIQGQNIPCLYGGRKWKCMVNMKKKKNGGT